MPLAATYVLPIKVARPQIGLTAYLNAVTGWVDDVVVVDGSGDDVFAAHRAAWPAAVRHVRVDPDLRFAFGKVNGVLTGVRHARHDAVVLADDDVRYTEATLAAVVARLRQAEAVVPQNYFEPLPWHAAWDSARSLLNRAVAHDYPGTLGVRRQVLLGTGGYDGDVLFENLELLRTVRAAGGRICQAPDVLVRREPPTAAHFRSQRVRQAYDSLAQPGRLAAELALLPAATWLVATRRWTALAAGAAAGIGLAEAGRRRHGGQRVFPARISLFAPAWLGERAVCIWLALGMRVFRGGVPYAGVGVIRRAATPQRVLDRRAAGISARPGGQSGSALISH